MTGRQRTTHALHSLTTAGARTALLVSLCLLVALSGFGTGGAKAAGRGEPGLGLVKARSAHHAKHGTHHRAHRAHRAHRGKHRHVRHTKRPAHHVSVTHVTKTPVKAPTTASTKTTVTAVTAAQAKNVKAAPVKVSQPTAAKATKAPKVPVRHDVTTIVKETSTKVASVGGIRGLLLANDAGPAPLPTPVGFGAATTGGAGGTVYHVTSSADSLVAPAPGTLRYGLSRGVPTWVVFDQDMQITLAGGLRVPANTTIDGRGHQVLLTGHGGAGLLIWDATNVIVEHLTLRDFGDTLHTVDNDIYDAVSIQRSSRVWIDHCTLSHAGDKLLSVVGGSKEVTVSWNRFYDQQQVVQIGTMASALADTNITVTMHHNFFDHVGYRLPLVAYGKAHVYDNYMLDWTVSGVRSERLAQVYLENNIMSAVAKPKAAIVEVASVCNDPGTYCDPRGGFLTAVGNLLTGKAAIAVSEPGHVFVPSQAYAYTAEPATTTLAATIAAGAGAR